jgi:uncharacterized repeat protein (TIGR03803 family)
MRRPTPGDLFAAVIVLIACRAMQAATPSFETLYNFTGEPDPSAPLAIGAGGVLYGTTAYGGSYLGGTVFSLTPPSSPGGAWTQAVLYEFTGGSDGFDPDPGLVVGPGGVLYGMASAGGSFDWGDVFSLAPPVSPGGAWVETVLYSFTGGSDGGRPNPGPLLASNGALYGTTYFGGANNSGVAFQVMPPSSPGSPWTEKVLHSFGGPGDGSQPTAGLTHIGGALYGTTYYGGAYGYGTVYLLAPPVLAGGAWTEDVLYSFTGASDGSWPNAGLTAATNGVLYGTTSGTTSSGGGESGGTVYSLTPPIAAGAPWTLAVLHSYYVAESPYPTSVVLIPSSGVLYGATFHGGLAGTIDCSFGCGTIYQLRPPATSGGAWTYTVVFYFTGANGSFPDGGLGLGGGGVLYGVTELGGSFGGGTVFALTL